MITPEEFVRAGDHLVYHCPTWSWAAGEQGRRKAYLPPDKQFLVTKNGTLTLSGAEFSRSPPPSPPPVPCYRRCSQVDVLPLNEKLLMMEGDDEAWVDTHHGLGEGKSGESTRALGSTRTTDFLPPSVVEQTAEKLVEMTMEAADKKTRPAVASSQPTPLVGSATEQDSDSDSEPAVDIDEYQVEDDDPVSEWEGVGG